MPIYEEGYHTWHGQLESKPWTWWVITKTGIKLLWRKGMIILLLLASIPFFVRAVQIYLVTRFGETGEIARALRDFQINPEFFNSFLQGQTFFLVLVLILSGASLIANDRKYKALPIYFSKPVSFWDYVVGKFLIVGFYGCLVTLVPSLLLFLIRVALARDAAFLKEYFWIPFSLLGYVVIVLIVLGGLILCLSSAARGTRSAAILFFALLTFPDLFRQILSRIPEIGIVSMSADIRQVGSLMFGLARPYYFSVWLAWIALIAVVGLCIGVLRVKVRPTEVVR